MHLPLCLSIASMVLVREVTSQQSRRVMTTKAASGLDDVTFTDSLLFEEETGSRGLCLALCAFQMEGCAAFTFTQQLTSSGAGVCRGHSVMMTSQSAFVFTARTSLFLLAEVTDWFGSDCTATAQCAPLFAQCMQSRCTCQAGYFYSYSLNTCLEDCASEDLASSFLKYASTAIDYHNLVTYAAVSLQECKDLCVALPGCRTADYRNGTSDCSLQGVVAREVPSYYKTFKDWDYYQRECL